MMKKTLLIATISLVIMMPVIASAYEQSRPRYVYDYADIISPQSEPKIEKYLESVDKATSNEIIIYTIKSFDGHGIKKDGQEIHERDSLANYIFNETPLDGITGIGKKGKDNGILILYSLERDSAKGSMRIEVGRGLEGNVTDGRAGEILDSYLVPARDEYETTGRINFDDAFYNTAVALSNVTQGDYTGYEKPTGTISPVQILIIIGVVVAFGIGVALAGGGESGGYYGGGRSGSFGGGSFGGGGGFSGGGGAGR